MSLPPAKLEQTTKQTEGKPTVRDPTPPVGPQPGTQPGTPLPSPTPPHPGSTSSTTTGRRVRPTHLPLNLCLRPGEEREEVTTTTVDRGEMSDDEVVIISHHRSRRDQHGIMVATAPTLSPTMSPLRKVRRRRTLSPRPPPPVSSLTYRHDPTKGWVQNKRQMAEARTLHKIERAQEQHRQQMEDEGLGQPR